jgi:hypothetical protein
MSVVSCTVLGHVDGEKHREALSRIALLEAALRRCLDYIENDEAAHGRTYGAGREARKALGREARKALGREARKALGIETEPEERK